MNEALDQLNDAIEPNITKTITNIISLNCLEALKSMKSVTNQYRHNDKPKPTEPSSFIPNIFKPFHTFVEQNQPCCTIELRDNWANTVAKNVVTQYTATLDDILISLTKTEKNKVKNSSKLSDEDKIRIQFLLDVGQIGKEVTQLIYIFIYKYILSVLFFSWIT